MNYWTELSIELASQHNYLDQLYSVYPCIPEDIRQINKVQWKAVADAFEKCDKPALIRGLLKLDLFPIKDSYVAYLKRDDSAIDRNPATVDRLFGRLRELGLDEIFERCSEPKETNRQIGPHFGRWLKKGIIGVPLYSEVLFTQSTNNAILDASDAQLLVFARNHLGYRGEKRPDFIARFNNHYVIGEAKFLSDFGGHQNAQFEDAKKLLADTTVKAVKIGILDGVLYIKGNNLMYRFLRTHSEEYNIMSALVLRNFLYQL